jgi:hypothetical protein
MIFSKYHEISSEKIKNKKLFHETPGETKENFH